MTGLRGCTMKYFAVLVFALLIPVAAQAADADTQNAIDAAKSWLMLVDANDYAQSWNTASTFLQSRITEAQWEKPPERRRATR